MRLSRSRLTRACVNSGIGRPEHASIRSASIPGSAGPSMRLSRSRLTRACVYASSMRLSGIGRPEHASIPEPVDPGMRLSRGRLAQACVYSGVGWPKHASIPEPVDPGMRLFRGRLARDRGRPEHASMRLFRGRRDRSHASISGRLVWACVYFRVGRPKHASIPGSVGLSMRWMKSDMRSASLRLAVPTGGPAFGCLRPASVSGGGSFARCAGDAGLKTGVPGRCRATVPV